MEELQEADIAAGRDPVKVRRDIFTYVAQASAEKQHADVRTEASEIAHRLSDITWDLLIAEPGVDDGSRVPSYA